MKARYAPPQPDADTFATQQAFLDYLIPVPIESVDEGSKKCPICWKPYGEAADPGFDNSEQPRPFLSNLLPSFQDLEATSWVSGYTLICGSQGH
jgi:hypothetical protein